MLRIAVAIASIAITASPTLLANAQPAAADCAGPTIEYTAGPVDRGQTVTVVGTAWGDNCYDTGPPPDGEGDLGRPLTGIEIVFAQGAAEIVVARGDADASYDFQVDVVVPQELTAGDARLLAKLPTGVRAYDPTNQPFVVSATEPLVTAAEVATFGATTTTTAVTSTSAAPLESQSAAASAATSESGSDSTLFWVVAGVLAVAMLCALLFQLPRRRVS